MWDGGGSAAWDEACKAQTPSLRVFLPRTFKSTFDRWFNAPSLQKRKRERERERESQREGQREREGGRGIVSDRAQTILERGGREQGGVGSAKSDTV